MPDQTTPASIGARELSALCEIARCQSGGGLKRIQPFFKRKASMQKLATYGLVEPFEGYGTEAQPAWKITDEGRRRVPHASE